MQDRVLGLDQDLRIVGGEVLDELLQDGIGRVGGAFYTQADRDLLAAVVLAKGRGDAFVETGLEALDGADDCDGRGIFEGGGYRRGVSFVEFDEAGSTEAQVISPKCCC